MCRLSDSRICRFLPRGRPRAGAGRHSPWGGRRHPPQSARRQAARGHWGGSATSRRSPCPHGCGKRGHARAAGMTRDVIPSRRWGEGRGGGRGRMRPCGLRRRCPFDRRAGGAGAGEKKKKRTAAASCVCDDRASSRSGRRRGRLPPPAPDPPAGYAFPASQLPSRPSSASPPNAVRPYSWTRRAPRRPPYSCPACTVLRRAQSAPARALCLNGRR